MLQWNVYVGDFNSGEIKTYNIFNHFSFHHCCLDAMKDFGDDKERFAEEIDSWMKYYFWCKCEWEIIIDHWPSNERMSNKKVDVYSQVRLNWDVFIDYLWGHRNELKRKGGRRVE